MRFKKLTCVTAMVLLAALGVPNRLAAQDQEIHNNPPHYRVFSLGSLGGTSSGASSINDRGRVSGFSNLPGNQTQHAVLWLNRSKFDLGTLGGPNSGVEWPNHNEGAVVGISETPAIDLLGEKWSCAAFFPSSTGHTCLGFVWQNGVMTPLPTLGGNNSYAAGANNRGQVVGWAENTVHDPTCVAPQVLQFRAVIWGPKQGQIQELAPLAGDTSTAATAINDKGQVVGISGICDQAVGRFTARHAVLWENGVPTDIGNLGGVAWNTPTAINNQGTVVGFSDFPGDESGVPNYHAFIWAKERGMHDLGTLPGDVRSAAFGINDKRQIVGLSRTPSRVLRAVLWENSAITDLNTLTLPSSPYLIYANDINDRGEIVGEAFDQSTGEAPAFLAIPRHDGDDN